MKLAYLILTHAHPTHFRRLIRSLAAPDCHFFVHVDRKSEIDDFVVPEVSNLHFLEDRVAVYWGEYSVVEAALRLLAKAVAASPFDYFILLSGADYPLYHRKEVRRFFAEHRGEEFIGVYAMDGGPDSKPLYRLTRFVPRSDRIDDPELLHKMRNEGILTVRDYQAGLGGLQPFCGSAWWALTGDACRYVLDFVDEHPEIVRFFENTLVPDEMFFQTILANSPFRQRLRRTLTYNDWSAGGAHPATICERHLPLFASAEFARKEILYARKFDDESQAVTSSIDAIARKRLRQRRLAKWLQFVARLIPGRRR